MNHLALTLAALDVPGTTTPQRGSRGGAAFTRAPLAEALKLTASEPNPAGSDAKLGSGAALIDITAADLSLRNTNTRRLIIPMRAGGFTHLAIALASTLNQAVNISTFSREGLSAVEALTNGGASLYSAVVDASGFSTISPAMPANANRNYAAPGLADYPFAYVELQYVAAAAPASGDLSIYILRR